MQELFKEKWTQWAAVATTILAVSAAISALKGGGYSTKVQVYTTQATNHWSYFQAKSIKQHVCETQRDLFAISSLEARPAVKKAYQEGILRLEKDIARYDQEKKEIKSQAEKMEREIDFFKRHSGYFGMAVMLLQIAIMMNSVSVLAKRAWLWIVGASFGLVGLIYMGCGFWL